MVQRYFLYFIWGALLTVLKRPFPVAISHPGYGSMWGIEDLFLLKLSGALGSPEMYSLMLGHHVVPYIEAGPSGSKAYTLKPVITLASEIES